MIYTSKFEVLFGVHVYSILSLNDDYLSIINILCTGFQEEVIIEIYSF